MRVKPLVLALVAVAALAVIGAAALVRPSNDRPWLPGQAVLAYASFERDSVTIHNMRNFTYGPDGAAVRAYENRAYDLDAIETVWFVLAPFERDNRGPAHTFLSFGFADSQYVAISVEARREVGEEYSLLRGLLRRYEILYVIGDERDLIGLRTNVRGDDVYVYPIRTSRENVRRLFVEMLERANRLRAQPEFYNTLFNNCTTNILDHVNSVAPNRIPYGKEVLLPGYADELAQRLGLLDSSLPIEAARRRFLVNERARKYAGRPDFSTRIRQPE